MGNQLKKVQSGERLKIPAATFNAMVDAARDYQQRQRGTEQQAFPAFRQSGIVLVKNETGADRDRFDAVGIDGVLITPADDADRFKNQVALRGAVPDAAVHAGRFVICLEPIAAGSLGRACVSGVCPARVYVHDTEHTCADVSDGDPSQLASAAVGAAQILWAETAAPGLQWAVVRLGVPPRADQVRFGVPAAAHTSGAAVTLTPCDVAGVPTGEDDFSAWWLADQASYAPANGTEIPVTARVPTVQAADGDWYVLGQPCVAIVDLRDSEPDQALQVRTQDIWGGFSGTVSDWVDKVATTDCAGGS